MLRRMPALSPRAQRMGPGAELFGILRCAQNDIDEVADSCAKVSSGGLGLPGSVVIGLVDIGFVVVGFLAFDFEMKFVHQPMNHRGQHQARQGD